MSIRQILVPQINHRHVKNVKEISTSVFSKLTKGNYKFQINNRHVQTDFLKATRFLICKLYFIQEIILV